ncbi:MAG: hypothetical protein ABSG17_19850 [Spirochaetia bacterium]|jgi:hypothetical protein
MKISATVHAPWQAALGRLVGMLREKGFHARRTFDLQLARQLLRSGEAELCPHHGTAPCNCQYIVLQITGPGRVPSMVVIHGHDRTTTISFLSSAGEEAKHDILSAVNEALEHLQIADEAERQAARHGKSDPKAHSYAGVRGHETRRRENI